MGRASKGHPEWVAIQRIVMRLDERRCRCCGSGHNVRVHHIIPESDGGPPFDQGNLVTLCQVCEKHVHKEFLKFTHDGALVGSPELSAMSIYNLCLLREMRLTGKKPSEKDSFRDSFLKRRARSHGSTLIDRQLSKRSRNLGNILDNHLDQDRMPWVLDFDPYEVEVRMKPDKDITPEAEL